METIATAELLSSHHKCFLLKGFNHFDSISNLPGLRFRSQMHFYDFEIEMIIHNNEKRKTSFIIFEKNFDENYQWCFVRSWTAIQMRANASEM